MVEGFAPKTTLPVPAIKEEAQETSSGYYGGSYENISQEVDLTNYYNEVHPEDLLTKTGQNVVEAAQTLDNTMVIAMQNGYSVQDVCNIRLAEMAYKANAYVFDIANEISTFALDV